MCSLIAESECSGKTYPNKEQERNDRYRAGFESSTWLQFPEREQERAISTEVRRSLKCHKDDVEPKGGKYRTAEMRLSRFVRSQNTG